MTLSNAMRVSSTGLSAERFRMDVISLNIANANSTKVGNTMPYARRDVVLLGGSDGVQVQQVVSDPTPFPTKYDPANPSADANGNVVSSNVKPVNEMIDMMSASRAYEANIAAFNSAKSMVKAALNIGKV